MSPLVRGHRLWAGPGQYRDWNDFHGMRLLRTAQSAVTTAYNALAGQACTADLTGQDLGGLTLTPGVYCFASSAQLTGITHSQRPERPHCGLGFQDREHAHDRIQLSLLS